MAKHTQTIRQILLSVFDHSVGLAPKGLTTVFLIDIQVSQTFKNVQDLYRVGFSIEFSTVLILHPRKSRSYEFMLLRPLVRSPYPRSSVCNCASL